MDDTGDNTLFTFDAEIMGNGLRFGDGKIHRNYVTNWKTNDQWMRWKVRINRSAKYDLFLDYNTVEDTDTGEVFFDIVGKNFTVTYPSHPEKKGTKSIYIGNITLSADEVECSLRGKNHRGNQFMNPISVRFIKKP